MLDPGSIATDVLEWMQGVQRRSGRCETDSETQGTVCQQRVIGVMGKTWNFRRGLAHHQRIVAVSNKDYSCYTSFTHSQRVIPPSERELQSLNMLCASSKGDQSPQCGNHRCGTSSTQSITFSAMEETHGNALDAELPPSGGSPSLRLLAICGTGPNSSAAEGALTPGGGPSALRFLAICEIGPKPPATGGA